MKNSYKLILLIILIPSFLHCGLLIGKDNAAPNQKPDKLIESQSNLLLKYSITSENSLMQKNIYSESNLFLSKDETVSNKSPWLAFGLSYLFPGLGQVYNGEYMKAVIFSGTAIVGAALAFVSIMGSNESFDNAPTLFWIGAAIGGGAYLWSMIDAPISASNINERNLKAGVRIFSTEEANFAIRLRNGIKLNNYFLDFSANF